MDIISYIKEYIRISLAVIRTPQAFFEGMKGERKGYLKPFVYMLVSYAVSTIGGYLGAFLLSASSSSMLYSSTLLFGFTGFIISLLLPIPFFLISIALMQLSVRIVGGKGAFNDTFKVLSYAVAPLNFAWVFMVPMSAAIAAKSTILMLIAMVFILLWLVSMLYILYIEIVGISVTSAITKTKAFVAIVIQIFIFFVIYMILIVAFVFFIGFNSGYQPDYSTRPYSPIEQSIENLKYSTTVYSGSAPQIDGITDEKDNWYEGEKTYVKAGGKDYTFATKHNFENIYILVEWEGTPEWNDRISLYFEQDGRVQDFNIGTGVVDNYYQGIFSYGPNSFSDAHFEDGYTVSETQNGNLKSGYADGIWKLEWQIPLSSGDRYDIDIDNFPTQVGFTIANERGMILGIWPPESDIYEPLTWGNMTIVDKKKN